MYVKNCEEELLNAYEKFICINNFAAGAELLLSKINFKSEDIKSDLKVLGSNFDFSNIPKSHELFDDSNRARLFRFKEKLGLNPILRYVGLASKVYCRQIACCHSFTTCCRCSDQDESNQKEMKFSEKLVCKGSSKFSMNNITFNDYFSCLNEQIPKHAQDYRIVSKKQILTTNYIQKMAF